MKFGSRLAAFGAALLLACLAAPPAAEAAAPTQRVGGAPLDSFEQREHHIPMLSIDDLFAEEEVEDFHKRLHKTLGDDPVSLTVEPKIDGVACSLVYRNGSLDYVIRNPDGSELLGLMSADKEYRGQLWQSGDHVVEVINPSNSSIDYNVIFGIE